MITGSSFTSIHKVIQSLQETFAVKDLDTLNYFLGIEALQCSDEIYLTQRKYIVDLLKWRNMDKTKPCNSPMASNCHLNSTNGNHFEDISLYWSIVGSMWYVAFTRPNLAFVVHKVHKFMHKPIDFHWFAVKHILPYLKHSVSIGLFIN